MLRPESQACLKAGARQDWQDPILESLHNWLNTIVVALQIVPRTLDVYQAIHAAQKAADAPRPSLANWPIAIA